MRKRGLRNVKLFERKFYRPKEANFCQNFFSVSKTARSTGLVFSIENIWFARFYFSSKIIQRLLKCFIF